MEAIWSCYGKMGDINKANAAGAAAIKAAANNKGWRGAACIRLRVDPAGCDDIAKALDVLEDAEQHAVSGGQVVEQRVNLHFQKRLFTRALEQDKDTFNALFADRLVQLELRILAFTQVHGTADEQADTLSRLADVAIAQLRHDDAVAFLQRAVDIQTREANHTKIAVALSTLVMAQVFRHDDAAAIAETRRVRDAALLISQGVAGLGSHIATTSNMLAAHGFHDDAAYELAVANAYCK
jgi:tetratricopeptide (TPR) repeat protein